MEKKIRDILDKGKGKKAGESYKHKMYSLFHKAEYEYELKGRLLVELNETEIQDSDSPDFKEIFESIWAKIEKSNSLSKSKTKFLSTFVRVAAAVVIGLFIGLYINSIKSNENPVYYAAHSPRGSVSEMILPDGSIIFLNSDSRIRYSIDGENGVREVFLEGEAYFDVEKNTEKAFVVHTPFYDVNVTGTQFNVKAYSSDEYVTTTLEEGQVIIPSAEAFKLAEDLILKPGEQVVLNKETQELVVAKVNTKWFTSWKDNKLIFVNMDMEELIVLLGRKYGIDIIIKDESILNLHFDGTIKNETIIEILDVIKITLPVDYKIIGQKIEITAK